VSYARLTPDSSVYVYETGGGIMCGSPCWHFTATAAEMATHLREHAARGDKVPAEALTALDADLCTSLACKAAYWHADRPERKRGHCGEWLTEAIR